MDVLISDLERDGEKRPFAAHGYAQLASAGGVTMLRGTFEPGWRWSTDVAPIAGTDSCQIRHLGYVVSGRMHVVTDDGTESEVRAGQLFDLGPGHDAWVVGEEACVMLDVSPDATRYASDGQPTQDPYVGLVRKGYAAFNTQDIEGLKAIFALDVVHHVPGHSAVAGEHKGLEEVLAYYGKLGEMTDGTFRAHLIDAHGDGAGHVIALHQITATRNGVTRSSRGSILFTFTHEKVTDLLEMHADLAGDDAFLA
jgi:ketosteroid isomerase-like protein